MTTTSVLSSLDLTASAGNRLPIPERINVLLIEDNQEQADVVRYELEQERERYRMEWVPNLLAGMQRLAQPGIDVVILDLGMPELSGAKTYTAVHVMAPDMPVLILTGDAQTDTRRSTLASGAADYLVKDQLSPGDLREAVRGAIARFRNTGRALPNRDPGADPGHAVLFLGAKGGVGTTTTVLNLAAATARQQSTIAMEGATHCGFSLHLPSLRPMVDRKQKPVPPDEEWMKRNVEPSALGAGLLFDPLSPWRVAPWSETSASAQYAKRIVGLARKMANCVFVDAGSQLDETTRAFLSECQTAIVVTDCEPASAAAASHALRWVEKNRKPNCELGVVAVNRSGLPALPALEELRTHYGRPALGVVPYAGAASAWTSPSRAPLAVLEPEGPLTSSILQLSWHLMERSAAKSA